MNLDWLNNIQAVEVQQEEKASKVRTKVSKNPESGLTLRVWKDGSVYPSQELVDNFTLEYGNRGSLGEVSNNGLDVIDSREWVQFPKGDDIPAMLFITAVSKNEPKVTLFGQVDYNEDGTPKKSVMNQGSKREEFRDKLTEVYGINFEEQSYVDLEINTEVTIFAGLPQYIIPKKIVKGVKQGQMSYVNRQNLTIHPLVVKQEVQVESVQVESETIVG